MKEFFKEVTNKDFLISIATFMLVQFILFIVSKNFEINYHIIASPIDSKIPFIPYIIYVYNIFGPFIFLVFYYIFCNDRRSYYQGIKAGIVGYIMAHIVFLTYPTIIIRPNIDSYNLDFITSNFIKLTYFIDNPPLNCFPSLHCLVCFQAIFTIIISKNIKFFPKIIIIILAILIAISTVFIKQHYFYDILGAFGIFVISNLIVFVLKKDAKIHHYLSIFRKNA